MIGQQSINDQLVNWRYFVNFEVICWDLKWLFVESLKVYKIYIIVAWNEDVCDDDLAIYFVIIQT
jgi:hypothetical protein